MVDGTTVVVVVVVVEVVVGAGVEDPVTVLVASLYPLRDVVTVSVADAPAAKPETVTFPEERETLPAEVVTPIVYEPRDEKLVIATVKPEAVDDGVPRVAATEFGRSVTCAVADDISDDEPFPLVAVTSNFRYLSTSSAVTV